MMIIMAMFSKTRRMYYREGISVGEIVRRTAQSPALQALDLRESSRGDSRRVTHLR